jgi:hypothetical protein
MSLGHTDIHIHAIRRAFANGNAAVMVGAGFSRNAEGGEQLATWPDMGVSLWDALNPGTERPAFSAASVIQLGEQYAQVFSVPALETLLKELIPDDKVAPGLLHEQLLSLPWSEVFTTNYDTLLERAADKLVDRAHFTVCSRQDIPLSKILARRRIVKLHGSFPSHRPFIFTEENYRRYPQEFAPFVNLVRQSLLENVFCLIGFSGDDPNFLQWIGWVRDVLDEHALPIYLFVDKEPPLGLRRMLEGRRVLPVVLPLPAGTADRDYRSRYEELFRLLRAREANDEEEWASIRLPPGTPEPHVSAQEDEVRTIAVLRRLASARATYPGWLVAPVQVRRVFRHSLDQLFANLERLITRSADNPADLIAIFDLYVWQQDVSLGPIHDEMALTALAAIAQSESMLGKQLSGPSGVLPALGIVEPTHFGKVWLSACLGVLRWARQEVRQTEFDRVRELLANHCSNPEVADLLQFESILFSLYSLDDAGAKRQLRGWKPRDVNPYMMVRKAALVGELGDADEAVGICVDAIQKIRSAQKSGRSGISMLSQEAWACFVARNIARAREFTFHSNAPKPDMTDRLEHLGVRLSALAAKGIDVRREYEELISELNEESGTSTQDRVVVRGFDIGTSSITRKMGLPQEIRSKLGAAESWMVLADRVGIVPRIGGVGFSIDSFLRSAWWCQYFNRPERTLALAARARSDDIFKQRDATLPPHRTGWVSRYFVALCSAEAAEGTCRRTLAQYEIALEESDNYGFERACNFYAELYSRLVIRVQDQSVLLDFTRVFCRLLRGERVRTRWRAWDALNKALTRTLEAANDTTISAAFQDLTSIPVVPASDADLHLLSYWVQPPLQRARLEPGAADEHARELLETLERTTSTGVRMLVWRRLFDLRPNVSEECASAIGNHLWRGIPDWPALPGFYANAALVWPAPDGILVEERFREHVLSMGLRPMSGGSGPVMMMAPDRKQQWSLHGDNTLLDAWKHSKREYPWPLSDTQRLVATARSWWSAEGAMIQSDIGSLPELAEATRQRFSKIDEPLAEVLAAEAPASTDSSGTAAELLDAARLLGAPMWRSRLALARRAASEAEAASSVVHELVGVFLADDVESSWEATPVLAELLTSDLADEIVAPAADGVVAAIVTRKRSALGAALQILEQSIRESSAWLDAPRRQLVDTGLTALVKELRYVSRTEQRKRAVIPS